LHIRHPLHPHSMNFYIISATPSWCRPPDLGSSGAHYCAVCQVVLEMKMLARYTTSPLRSTQLTTSQPSSVLDALRTARPAPCRHWNCFPYLRNYRIDEADHHSTILSTECSQHRKPLLPAVTGIASHICGTMGSTKLTTIQPSSALTPLLTLQAPVSCRPG